MNTYHKIMAGIGLGCTVSNIFFAFYFIGERWAPFHIMCAIFCFMGYSFHKNRIKEDDSAE